ncbi:MAG: hypothetical protein ABI330_01875, partial [Caldimonas sp.]
MANQVLQRAWRVACACSVLASASAYASDYGCKVLLCLANPAGPTAVSQCVPPITQLWRDLAHVPPRPFPTCDEARPAIAVQNTTWYDSCPERTTALDAGVYAVLQGAGEFASPIIGIGEGDNLQPIGGDNPFVLGSKVCVGRQVGQVSVQVGYGENATSVLANVYDRLALLDPAISPRVIDVYLNN